MSKGLKIKIAVVLFSLLFFSLVEKYILNHTLNFGTILTVLASILPITFLVKFPKKE
jgi:hypothetical protein